MQRMVFNSQKWGATLKLRKQGVPSGRQRPLAAISAVSLPKNHLTILVFSAHAADFCSRCGGTIAVQISMGAQVHVVDLTFGERGESEDYWVGKGPKSLPQAKKTRAREAREAARIL